MTALGASPSKTPSTDIWSKRLALGLPALVIVLLLVAANQIGAILVAKDLRADYAALLDGASAEPTGPGGDAAPAATAPDERPEIDVALTLTEFGIDADVDEIPAWATVTFSVTNDGEIPHDAAVGDEKTSLLNHGESDSFTVDAPGSGSLEVICSVPGHEAAGMTLALPIAGDTGDTGDTAAPATGQEASGDPAASPDNADDYDGDKPPLELRDPTTAPAPDSTVHDITWTIEEKVVQVAEGIWQEAWTFEGQAPGPTLRVKVGDTVNLTLRNPADSTVGHSMDFHASHVAWNDEMRTIDPGEELEYSFTARHAGVFMYHCGTAPTLHHIGNAMHGMIIVEPADGLDDVDHEFFFVQHEYYLGPQGQPGDLEKMSRTAAEPDLVVFNGVANQYLDNPIAVGVDERIRVWVVNNGPSADTSFHVVGSIFDTVVKEGISLTRDNPGRWGSQAVDLAPAQGAYVEFELAEDGMYPFVSHAFNQVGAGAIGLFQAGDGGPAVEGGH